MNKDNFFESLRQLKKEILTGTLPLKISEKGTKKTEVYPDEHAHTSIIKINEVYTLTWSKETLSSDIVKQQIRNFEKYFTTANPANP